MADAGGREVPIDVRFHGQNIDAEPFLALPQGIGRSIIEVQKTFDFCIHSRSKLCADSVRVATREKRGFSEPKPAFQSNQDVGYSIGSKANVITSYKPTCRY